VARDRRIARARARVGCAGRIGGARPRRPPTSADTDAAGAGAGAGAVGRSGARRGRGPADDRARRGRLRRRAVSSARRTCGRHGRLPTRVASPDGIAPRRSRRTARTSGPGRGRLGRQGIRAHRLASSSTWAAAVEDRTADRGTDRRPTSGTAIRTSTSGDPIVALDPPTRRAAGRRSLTPITLRPIPVAVKAPVGFRDGRPGCGRLRGWPAP